MDYDTRYSVLFGGFPSPALTECRLKMIDLLLFCLLNVIDCYSIGFVPIQSLQVLCGCMSTDEEIRFDTQGVDKVLSLEVPLCM